jgi:hypothetical protein
VYKEYWNILDSENNIVNTIIGNEDAIKEYVENTEFTYQLFRKRLNYDAIENARSKRDSELQRTDQYMLLSDYPYSEEMKEYRQRLRDWPDSEDFPETFPDFDAIVEEFKQSANRNI